MNWIKIFVIFLKSSEKKKKNVSNYSTIINLKNFFEF